MARPNRNIMMGVMVQVAKIIRVTIKEKKRGESFPLFLANALDSPVRSFSEDNAKKIIKESNNLKGRELALFQTGLAVLGPALYAINMGKGENKYKNKDTDAFLIGMLRAFRQADYYHLGRLYEFDNLGEFEPIVKQLRVAEESIYNLSEEELVAYQSSLSDAFHIGMNLIDPQLKIEIKIEK